MTSYCFNTIQVWCGGVSVKSFFQCLAGSPHLPDVSQQALVHGDKVSRICTHAQYRQQGNKMANIINLANEKAGQEEALRSGNKARRTFFEGQYSADGFMADTREGLGEMVVGGVPQGVHVGSATQTWRGGVTPMYLSHRVSF